MNTDTQDGRESEVRETIRKCYNIDDQDKCYELVSEVIAFGQMLRDKYGDQKCNRTRLFHSLALSTIDPKIDKRSLDLDFEGEDSIYNFALELAKRL